ncbi:MAG: hypothetical protein IID40_01870 [Planctomycetes bacterium]|nr:hypothetical protein [Planctomycetota bacterium]
MMDVSMAARQGHELADTLVRQRPALADVIMSGHITEHQPSEAAPGREIAFLQQPFRPPESAVARGGAAGRGGAMIV